MCPLPSNIEVILLGIPSAAVMEFCPVTGDKSNPHVRTNLYTTPNTRTLTNMSTNAVITFAKALSPVSEGSTGLELGWLHLRLFPAKPRAKAGKARLCVNVSLCNDSDRLYGPTLPLVAALSSAYSRSRASSNEYRAVIVELRRRSRSCCSHGSEVL